MNDLFYIGVGAVAILAGLLAFIGFQVYGGVHGSLANARVGEVYSFDYEQPFHGESKRMLAKVVEPVYTLDNAAISRLNRRSSYRRNDPVFHRTNHLVTCEMPNGEIRQFYAERTKNVRRTVMFGNVLRHAAAFI